MEPVGLVVGIIGLAGLFSTCLDLAEKIDDYKHFKSDERALAAQFVSHRLRFEKWGKALGLDQTATNLSEDRHEALTDAETLQTVRKIFDIIREILSDQRQNSSPRSAVNSTRLLARSLTEPFRITPGSRREKLSWALKGKGKREDQVELFGKLVQHLYHLVPIKAIARIATTANGNQTSDPTAQIDPQSGIDNSAWTTEIRDTLQRLDGKAHAETRRELHAWIVRHPPNEIYEDAIQRRLAGTCEWILERPILTEWLSFPKGPETSRFLWINGPAGFGKTVLCARIVQHLLQIVKTPVAHFFFSSDFESRDDPYEAIRLWISEVISRSQPAFDYVRKKWETQHESVATRIYVLQIFSEIISIVPGCVFVIDGLDECTWLYKGNNPSRGNSIADFLEKLGRATANSATRILIVSRDEPEIRSGIESIESKTFEYQIVPEDVDSDTTRYSRSLVDKKLSKKSESLKDDISIKMAERCGGQFLWLKLQEDSLRSWKNQKQLQDAIEKAPSGLDSLYDRNWVRLSRLPEEERDRAFLLLRWSTFAMRPLTVAEIAEAVLINFESKELPVDELPDFIDDDYINSEIIGICGSLLSIRKSSNKLDPGLSTIRLAHFSIKQYFLSHIPSSGDILRTNEKLRLSNERTENTTLAQFCLRYIHYQQIWQIEREQGPCQVQGSFKDYAAGYWHRHAHNGLLDDELLNELIHSLFNQYGTIWEPWKEWFDHGEKLRMEDYLEMADDDGERQRRREALSDFMPCNPVYYASKLDLTLITLKLIKEHQPQLDDKSYFGETALAAACKNGNQAISRALIEAGANVRVAGYDGATPLHLAANEGHLNLVRLLLESGADSDAIDKNLATALHNASREGHVDTAKLLLEHGASYLIQNYRGNTPLHLAAGSGNLGVMQLLISEEPNQMNLTDISSQTPLHTAAINGQAEASRLLLDHGADIHATDEDGCTPLISASFFGFTKVVRVLLDRGSDVNMPDSLGRVALTFTARNGYTEIAELLLENGADVTLVENSGWSALQNAACFGSVDITRVLLMNGADLTFTSREGYDALLFAAERGQTGVIRVLLEYGVDIPAAQLKKQTPLGMAIIEGHYETVELLLNNGANYSSTLEFGRLPITLASQEGHISIAKLLLDLGASVADSTANGEMPLLAAVYNNKTDMVQFLLENGANATTADNDGNTPLKSSIYEGNVEIVRLLLEYGADFSIEDDKGWKPLGLAARNGHVDIVQLLLDKGSDITATDSDGWSVLHSAADGGHADVVNFLLHKGVQLATLDHSGKTALHIASKEGHQEIVEILLKQYTSDEVDRADNNQRTPLLYAAMRGHSNVVKALLSKNAEVNAEDSYGSTALIVAVRNGHLEIVNQLLSVEKVIAASKDYFGKNILFWASKTGNTQMINRLEQFLEGKGLEIPDNPTPVSEQNCMPFNKKVYWCDVCTRCIPVGTEYFECSGCNLVYFLACMECVAMGAECLNKSHKWAVTTEQILISSDEEDNTDE
ncbi:ankyrin repeat domain-containing 52 [Trichoderma arundinaceum]|uniref:Ankyrin repeat domain-containing 52 n=1 Tax=Trichoderma arundinaceum TaxID=490622 RepID=A0A395NH86_TRIAR|nr:ankyrin repeat domain-containing 52 [Trichoderma arundinaceum]